MTKRLPWDYWLYEDVGDNRKVSIYLLQHIEDRDWRNEKYELDIRKWCREFYWNADQAALISFSRDPEKLETALDGSGEDVELEEHIELKKHIFALHDMIVDAQKKGLLPDFFRPEMYVEWSKRVGISIPTTIPEELYWAERQRNYRGPPPNIFQKAKGDWPTDEMLASVEDYVRSDEKGKVPIENTTDLRENLKNSYLRIIAELWEMVDFDRTSTSLNELTKQIGSSLETKAKKNSIFELDDPTIRKHLKAASDRFKNITLK